MSMRVQIPIAALADSAVASALARLMEALGNANIQDVQTTYVSSPATQEVKRAPRKSAVVQSEDPEERYQKFLASLPSRSREFLELVQKCGTVTIDEAMEALHMTVGKAMGGLTGSIARWAPDYGVNVPFEAVKGPQGRRAWRWIGLDHSASEVKAPEATTETVEAKVEVSDAVMLETSDQRLAAVIEKLSNSSKRFLDLVCEHSKKGELLTKNKALEFFGFSRASAITDLVRPIRDALSEVGLEKCLITVNSDTGETSWKWIDPADLPASDDEPERQMAGVRVRKSVTE